MQIDGTEPFVNNSEYAGFPEQDIRQQQQQARQAITEHHGGFHCVKLRTKHLQMVYQYQLLL